jgi:hypothetical protein
LIAASSAIATVAAVGIRAGRAGRTSSAIGP